MTRKALGRGLSALLQEVEAKPAGAEQVDLDLIDPNPLQPRHDFPPSTLKELADSIRSSGVVQPVLLRRADARYELVAGERRWRAARMAGLTSIPALVRDLNDRDALELALTENLLREDLNAIEVARAYEVLQQRFQLTHEEIAELELGQETDRRVILEREITLAIRDAVRSLHSIAEEITSVDRSIAVAEEKLDFANTMFKLGRASNLDITDAREALLKSRNQHARRVADYHGELSALESLTGLALAP